MVVHICGAPRNRGARDKRRDDQTWRRANFITNCQAYCPIVDMVRTNNIQALENVTPPQWGYYDKYCETCIIWDALEKADCSVVKWLVDHNIKLCPNHQESMHIIAARNEPELFKALYKKYNFDTRQVMKQVIKSGTVEMFECIYDYIRDFGHNHVNPSSNTEVYTDLSRADRISIINHSRLDIADYLFNRKLYPTDFEEEYLLWFRSSPNGPKFVQWLLDHDIIKRGEKMTIYKICGDRQYKCCVSGYVRSSYF